jgi:hypothetical protein
MEHAADVEVVAFSPDGRTVAGVSRDDKAIRLWEVATGRQRLLVPHDTLVKSLAFAPDGRCLVATDDSATVYVWDVLTGAELPRFTGHQGSVSSVAFSPDGKHLATGSTDTAVLLWDTTLVLQRTAGRAVSLPGKELEGLWRHLGSADAEQAYRAVCRLALSPINTVAFFRERLHPVPPATAQQTEAIRRWIADLGSPRFRVRSTALRELEALGEMAVPTLRKALPRAVELEARRRLEELLRKLAERMPTGETLRGLRAVEALEHAATPETRSLLQALAAGAPHARLTRAARAALERLARKSP